MSKPRTFIVVRIPIEVMKPIKELAVIKHTSPGCVLATLARIALRHPKEVQDEEFIKRKGRGLSFQKDNDPRRTKFPLNNDYGKTARQKHNSAILKQFLSLHNIETEEDNK